MIEDAKRIMEAAIQDVMPAQGVYRALDQITLPVDGKLVVIAAGKAAWEMGRAASVRLGALIDEGIIITKYGYSKRPLSRFEIYEAGHPVPDANSFLATSRALAMVEKLGEKDTVLFLLSGGGSALFEYPLVPEEELISVTEQLLGSSANIVEINTVRKRLSAVKAGRFALRCAPAHVFSVVLSDVIGDPLDMIASGPAYPDLSTSAQALDICERYGIRLSRESLFFLRERTVREIHNVTTYVTGSVRELCHSACRTAKGLGYKPVVLTSSLGCEAREAGRFLSSIAREYQDAERSYAFLAGGETMVHVKGSGRGGRNQEIALAAAEGIARCDHTCIFSFASDGVDGPTDAAGGYVDEFTMDALEKAGVHYRNELENNNSYEALKKVGGLLMTGPTGTKVNDLSVILIRR